MFRSIKDLIGYKGIASDGKAGKITDVLFGDRHWRMRYLVLDTTPSLRFNLHYLSEKSEDRPTPALVLIKPENLDHILLGDHRREVPIRMDVDGVRHCENLSAHLPIEQQYDAEFTKYYRHSIYDDRPIIGVSNDREEVDYWPPDTAYEHEKAELEAHQRHINEIAKQHLHSAKQVLGYRLQASQEILGPITDFILDDDTWEVRYLVTSMSHWHPKRRFLVDTSTIDYLDWSNQTAVTQLMTVEIESSEEFHPHDPVNYTIDQNAYDYYGKRARQPFQIAHA